MVSKQPDRLPTAPPRDRVQPATVRSALLNRNAPRRRCAQQVRFRDLEEDGGLAPGGRTASERHRLGAGPGSPHPNRKSPPGPASRGSVVGAVWGDMAGTVESVAAILAKVSPHPLTPGPARRALATPRPSPLCVARTYSHSLEDVLGPERSKGRAAPNSMPRSTTAQLGCDAHSRLPHREERPLKEEGRHNAICPPLPQRRTDSAPCPPVSTVTGSAGPTQSRRWRLTRALSDPGNEDLPTAPPQTLPPGGAPPTAENTQRGVGRGGVKQAQLPLPPLPPPPPPYCPPKERSRCSPRPPRTPPMPHPRSTPPTPRKVGPARQTHNPAPNPNPAPHQQTTGNTDPPLTPDQARMLKEVERLLGGLVSGARGGDGSKVGLLGPQGPLSDVQGLKSRLQSLEGLLETSHDTIRLLLRVIQDLELKEGQSERKTSYKTGQKMAGHGTSKDNACVIYSVENDFRLQEGIFAQSWVKVDSQISENSSHQATPSLPLNSNPRPEEPSLPAQPPHTGRPPRPAKKSRRKCFWFL